MPILESWERTEVDPERKTLIAALRQWAVRFRITEDWIFDAALETLITYFPRHEGPLDAMLPTIPKRDPNEPWLWRYRPKGFHPRFKPAFEADFWYPPHHGWNESWDDFKHRMESQLSTQLIQYRRTVETSFAIGKKETLQRDAEWTARYQRGESAIEIAETKEWNIQDPEQAIFRAVSRFAQSIGLNLRRRGRRTKRPVVQSKP
jgi:hypothetical protein